MRALIVSGLLIGLALPIASDAAPQDAKIAASTALPSPIAQRQAIVEALRVDDFRAVLEARMGAQEYLRSQQQWQRGADNRAKRKSDPDAETSVREQDQKLVEVWQQLQTPTGVDQLLLEWQPLLAEQASTRVIEFNLGLAAMLNSLSDEKSLSADEMLQARDLILAVQRWANGMDFNDATRLRKALDAVSVAVRATRLESPEDFEALSFEQALDSGNAFLVAAKQVTAAYDIDADVILASVRFSELERDGERATIRTEARILDVPVHFDQKLRWWQGEWQDAALVERMTELESEQPVDESATVEEVTDTAAAASAKATADAKAAADASAAAPSCAAPESTKQ